MRTGPDLHVTEVLSDGTRVTLRHIRPSDAEELRRGFEHLSRESRYRRFLRVSELTDDMLRYLTEVDGTDHVAIVAVGTSPDLKSEVGYGVARFVRRQDEPHVAEAAITVVDEMQHKGLGRLLALTLAEAARERGITHFRGEALESNVPVRQLLDEVHARVHGGGEGVIVFDVALCPERESEPVIRRLTRAAAESLVGLVHLPRLDTSPPPPPSSEALRPSDVPSP